MRFSPWLILFCVAATAGLVFAGFSTHDFVQHLDRQVHSITCSFIPGLAAPDASGASGCHVTLMSPYSSVFRKDVWGGLPISLPAMAVFAFLLFRGVDTMVNRRSDEVAPRTFLVAASLVPVLASVVMGYIALAELDAACKLCIGIYASSALCLVGAVLAWREAKSAPELGADIGLAFDGDREEENPLREHALSFGQGVGFVAVPALVYLIAMPSYDQYVGGCGELLKTDDPNKVMVPLEVGSGGRKAIEVVDPLCPSCRAFEKRLFASGLAEGMSRDAVLFPLDNTCNWMVGSAVHPGACTVSEAVLCAEGQGKAVLEWAFANQEAIREAATKDPGAAAEMVGAAFPQVKGCIGKPAVKSRLNKSLRWVVANQLPVLTPQFFVDGKKLCDADTDLGMDYALSRLLAPPEAP
ncbi:MAG: vitamin K epoxide reductase family protein [Myxococcota bacterium]